MYGDIGQVGHVADAKAQRIDLAVPHLEGRQHDLAAGPVKITNVAVIPLMSRIGDRPNSAGCTMA